MAIMPRYFSLDARVRTDVQDWLEKNKSPRTFYFHGGWLGGNGWAINSQNGPTSKEKFNLEISDEKIATYLILRFG
jgi:hypothetical protein